MLALGFSVIGNQVNVAARLESPAKSGQILVRGPTAGSKEFIARSWAPTLIISMTYLMAMGQNTVTRPSPTITRDMFIDL